MPSCRRAVARFASGGGGGGTAHTSSATASGQGLLIIMDSAPAGAALGGGTAPRLGRRGHRHLRDLRRVLRPREGPQERGGTATPLLFKGVSSVRMSWSTPPP